MKLSFTFMTACKASALVGASLFAAESRAEQLDAGNQMQLRVHGDIVEHCEIGGGSAVDFGDLTRAGMTADIAANLNCNLPFNLRIESTRGGLTNLEHPLGQGPYAGTLPYTLSLDFAVRRPAYGIVSRSFESRTLKGAQTVSSGGGIARNGLNLHVALGRPAGEAGLVAGNYSDTIVINVSPT